ncbi:hypothetical protein Thit_2092 [Thermoanaerobacter italicus Ab9]|uniref:Uncharacterized protein n=1 Tax=Thermoanaerobacter italicus (strain DSM 9252 / Ab9) TaxID=580331 RepID=D3T526_THEIA|nr:hypothetical protein [Thermoanaerobacter italicus]ADD03319.1 hypothetical protein Thit_2092 [Thermoanaerobacter italicus Ab9]
MNAFSKIVGIVGIIIAIISRIVFWGGLIVIVGRYVIEKFIIGDIIMAVLGLIFFPLTYFISPWFTGLWWLLLLSLTAYWISTILGLPPVE